MVNNNDNFVTALEIQPYEDEEEQEQAIDEQV
jgi:hypothetical protein